MLAKLQPELIEAKPRHVAPNKRTPILQMMSQVSTFNSSALKIDEDKVYIR
jgi:hypothetical protein